MRTSLWKTCKRSGFFALEKHSLTIAGHRTSVTLEPVFWRAVREIARQRGQTIAALITRIDAERDGNLSSALRVFVIEHYRVELGLEVSDHAR